MKSKQKKTVSASKVKEFDFDHYLKLKKAERVKLLQQMVEKLDPQSRKNFYKSLLPYVLSDDELTKEAFKYNTGKQESKKSRIVELTDKEKEMIGQIADYFHELELIMDLDELIFNP
jgi:hypothetical protein